MRGAPELVSKWASVAYKLSLKYSSDRQKECVSMKSCEYYAFPIVNKTFLSDMTCNST